jgi:hypothetical protein
MLGIHYNLLIINVLHKKTHAWAGVIHVLAAALYLFYILSAAGRTGINPAPTAAECCKHLSINSLYRNIKVYKYCKLIRSGRRSAYRVRDNDPLAGEAGRVRDLRSIVWPNLSCISEANTAAPALPCNLPLRIRVDFVWQVFT